MHHNMEGLSPESLSMPGSYGVAPTLDPPGGLWKRLAKHEIRAMEHVVDIGIYLYPLQTIARYIKSATFLAASPCIMVK